MKKFVVIYRVPVETMEKWKKDTSPEEMKAQGEKLGRDMMAWTAKNQKSFVGDGLPLGKNIRMDSNGAQSVTNDLNYMSVVEAESSDAVVEIFKDNPHFVIASSFVDIMEVPEHMGM